MRLFVRAACARGDSARLMIAFCGTAGLAAAAAIMAALIVHFCFRSPDINLLRHMFVEAYWSDVRPEPAERAAWLTGVAISFPVALFALRLARGLPGEGLPSLCMPLLCSLSAVFPCFSSVQISQAIFCAAIWPILPLGGRTRCCGFWCQRQAPSQFSWSVKALMDKGSNA